MSVKQRRNVIRSITGAFLLHRKLFQQKINRVMMNRKTRKINVRNEAFLNMIIKPERLRRLQRQEKN